MDYQLRGGRQPDVAAITNVLAHLGVRGPGDDPLSEPLVFAVSGGIGAGYILWEFADDTKPLVLGFRSQWQYAQPWLKASLARLGLPFDVHTTGGSRGAAKRLAAEFDEGNPVIVLPDRYLLGYWHLPPSLEARGGHFIVAYAQADGKVYVDDRNLAPLTVERKAFDAARSRVGSYKNLLVSVKPGQPRDLAAAVREGLADCARRLSGNSTSFSLPAWGKWAKLMTDEHSVKGWPVVFADRRGLVGALLSIWEGVEPAGMTGGHLRDLFADGLAEAAPLLELPALEKLAGRWREISQRWHELAEAAVDNDIPEFAWMRGLTTAVSDGVRAGDEGQVKAAESAAELWRLRAHYDTETPFTETQARTLFTDLAARLRDIHAAEFDAIAELREIVTPPA